ncbi:MAG: hypothetical protein OXP69_10915 [Spirochaetaceae bacterium]|nr:hypothetical protein [Spirochaetaceae bacterium]
MRRVGADELLARQQVEAQVGNVGVEQVAVPGEGIEDAHHDQQRRASQREQQLLARAQEHDGQQHQGNRGVVHPQRRGQHGEAGRAPDYRWAVDFRSHAQRQQPDQRRRGDQLRERFVREGGQFVPERPREQRRPRRGLAEVAPREAIHPGRNRQRKRAEQQLDPTDVPGRLAQANQVEQLEHRRHHTRDQPGAGAVEVLPVDYPVAEHQPVGRLQVLHDLIRMQHEVAAQGDRRPRRERQRQHQGGEPPARLIRRVGVDQSVEQGACQGRR